MTSHVCDFKISSFSKNIRCCKCGNIERKNKGKESWRPVEGASVSWTDENGKKKTKKRHQFIGDTFKHKYDKNLEYYQTDINDYSFDSLKGYSRGFPTIFKKYLMNPDAMNNIIPSRIYESGWRDYWDDLDEDEREEEGGILGIKFPITYRLKFNIKFKGSTIEPEDILETRYEYRKLKPHEIYKNKQQAIKGNLHPVGNVNECRDIPIKKTFNGKSLRQVLNNKRKIIEYLYEDYEPTIDFNPNDIYKDEMSYIDYFRNTMKTFDIPEYDELMEMYPVPEKLMKKHYGAVKPKEKSKLPKAPKPEPEEKQPTARDIYIKDKKEREARAEAKVKEEDKKQAEILDAMFDNIKEKLKGAGKKWNNKKGLIVDIK